MAVDAHVEPIMGGKHRWPRFERFIDLAALPTALLCTRLFVASTLQWWGARFLEADVELLAVELVRHSVATCGVLDENVRLSELEDVIVIRLRLLGFERSVGIEVWDTATELAWLPANTKDGKPFGLGVVDARAQEWGWHLASGGRVLWAELGVYERTGTGLPIRPRRPTSYSRLSAAEGEHSSQELGFLRRVRDSLQNL